MNVEQLMSKDLRTCTPSDSLGCAAQIMWERDCGVVPIVDQAGSAVGVITDRDICMATYTQGRLLNEIPISSIALKPVVSVRQGDSLQTAESQMRKHQVRRLVVTNDQGRLVGMLSLNDLARNAERNPRDMPSDELTGTLAAISQPRARTATARA